MKERSMLSRTAEYLLDVLICIIKASVIALAVIVSILIKPYFVEPEDTYMDAEIVFTDAEETTPEIIYTVEDMMTIFPQ